MTYSLRVASSVALLSLKSERHETVKLAYIEGPPNERKRTIVQGLCLHVGSRRARDYEHWDWIMEGMDLFEEQDGRLAAGTACRSAQTGPRPPRGSETENQNQIKRPMQEHRQSIVTIKDCLDLVSFDGLKAFQGIPAQNGVATTSRTRRLTITIVRLPAGVYRARGGVPHPGGVSGAGSARYPFRLSHAWTALRKPYHPLPL